MEAGHVAQAARDDEDTALDRWCATPSAATSWPRPTRSRRSPRLWSRRSRRRRPTRGLGRWRTAWPRWVGTGPPAGKVCGSVERATTNEDFLVERVGDQSVFDGVGGSMRPNRTSSTPGSASPTPGPTRGSGPSPSRTTWPLSTSRRAQTAPGTSTSTATGWPSTSCMRGTTCAGGWRSAPGDARGTSSGSRGRRSATTTSPSTTLSSQEGCTHRMTGRTAVIDGLMRTGAAALGVAVLAVVVPRADLADPATLAGLVLLVVAVVGMLTHRLYGERPCLPYLRLQRWSRSASVSHRPRHWSSGICGSAACRWCSHWPRRS